MAGARPWNKKALSSKNKKSFPFPSLLQLALLSFQFFMPGFRKKSSIPFTASQFRIGQTSATTFSTESSGMLVIGVGRQSFNSPPLFVTTHQHSQA
jgi:hypothetical protein